MQRERVLALPLDIEDRRAAEDGVDAVGEPLRRGLNLATFEGDFPSSTPRLSRRGPSSRLRGRVRARAWAGSGRRARARNRSAGGGPAGDVDLGITRRGPRVRRARGLGARAFKRT